MATPSERYGRYVEYYGLVRRVIADGDTVQLRRIQTVTAALPRAERKVSSVAIHDVALHLPMRGEEHLNRLLDEDWDPDNGYFVLLLEELGAKAEAKQRARNT
jgi:hypothetical protein